MTGFGPILRRLVQDFEDLRLHWALVGGLAVSARAEPRTTRDVDVAVAAGDDADAEQVVLNLRQRGYRDAGQMIEQQATGRLATMRIVSPVVVDATVVVDLIFASTGIEHEIVREASPVDVLPGTTIPVASLAHLLAMKVLAGRLQDAADFASLMRHASPGDCDDARAALRLMRDRKTHRQKDLLLEFDRLCTAAREQG